MTGIILLAENVIKRHHRNDTETVTTGHLIVSPLQSIKGETFLLPILQVEKEKETTNDVINITVKVINAKVLRNVTFHR